MENDFDQLIRLAVSGATPHKASTIFDGKIVEGAKQSPWSMEDIVAEAYDREVINPEQLSWDDAIGYVREFVAALKVPPESES